MKILDEIKERFPDDDEFIQEMEIRLSVSEKMIREIIGQFSLPPKKLGRMESANRINSSCGQERIFEFPNGTRVIYRL